MVLLGKRRQFSDNHTHRRRASAQIPQCHEQQKAFGMRNLRPDNRPFLDTLNVPSLEQMARGTAVRTENAIRMITVSRFFPPYIIFQL